MIDIKPNGCCDRWKFYQGWLPGKLLAVHVIGKSKWNATAKNRWYYCCKKGYTSKHDFWDEWNNHLDDIYAINTSATHRQGREMSAAYLQYPHKKTVDNPCKDHQYHLVTVSDDQGYWVAYAIIHIMGNLCNISTIIGHAAHLKNGIMLLLMREIISVCSVYNVVFLDYGEWESGTPGLRYWKHSVGFEPMTLMV
jgi:hypothetical protein